MNLYLLNEDKRPTRLFVKFSPEISKTIDTIDTYNEANIDGVSKWYDYLDGITSYLSNPAIAWDYSNRYTRYPNGAVHITDLGYDVAFIVKISKTTKRPYVYVFRVNLKPEEFGLKVPTMMECVKRKGKVYRLTESQLRSIITETIKNYLLSA